MIGAAVVLTVVALLVAVLVILCARGVIRLNGFVGIRIAAVTANEDAWERGHRAAILPTVLGAIAAVLLTITTLLLPQTQQWGPLAVVVALIAGLAWGAVSANRAAR